MKTLLNLRILGFISKGRRLNWLFATLLFCLLIAPIAVQAGAKIESIDGIDNGYVVKSAACVDCFRIDDQGTIHFNTGKSYVHSTSSGWNEIKAPGTFAASSFIFNMELNGITPVLLMREPQEKSGYILNNVLSLGSIASGKISTKSVFSNSAYKVAFGHSLTLDDQGNPLFFYGEGNSFVTTKSQYLDRLYPQKITKVVNGSKKTIDLPATVDVVEKIVKLGKDGKEYVLYLKSANQGLNTFFLSYWFDGIGAQLVKTYKKAYSLTLDGQGIAHMAYFDPSTKKLIYRGLNDGNPVTVDGEGGGIYNSIAVTSDGKIYIAYTEISDDKKKWKVKIAKSDDGKSFVISEVAFGGKKQMAGRVFLTFSPKGKALLCISTKGGKYIYSFKFDSPDRLTSSKDEVK